MFRDSVRKRIHYYRIEYTIMVNGENYPRSIDMPGRDADDARARWEKYRDSAFNDSDYLFHSITQIH